VQDIFLIGGSPSSGSTLLVNLLKRYENLICLPETGLFSHGRNLIDLSMDFQEGDLTHYLPWLASDLKTSRVLGWDKKTYDSAIKQHTTAFDLLRSSIDPQIGRASCRERV